MESLRINIYRGQVDGTVDLNNAIKIPDSGNKVPDKIEIVPDTMKKMPDSEQERAILKIKSIKMEDSIRLHKIFTKELALTICYCDVGFV